MVETEIFMTWDNHCLKKLREIGRSTLTQWAKAMGEKYSSSMAIVARKNPDKVIITRSRSNRKLYEVKEEIPIE